MKHFFILIFLLGCNWQSFSQVDSITVLEKVMLTNTKLKDFSTGQTLVKLSDSTLADNKPLLTSVLNYNTPIYFKENGNGMVSSPSFRGTTASQTAVLWNGININSQFNGQTDFNTINAGSYDAIEVRAGGGSIVYGTGAIGGTVHLNSALNFEPEFKNSLQVSYGSFNTLDTRYKLKASSKKWSVAFSVVRNDSENDYELPNSHGNNENGQYYNTGLNGGIGYKLNKNNTLTLHSQFTEGERHFSILRSSESKSKYQDVNARNLLTWNYKFSKFTSVLKLAFLQEQYKYFQNIKRESYTFGKAETYLGKYDLTYDFSKNIKLNAILSHTQTNGYGSNIEKSIRKVSSGAVLMKHQLNSKLRYEIAFRQEITNDYKSPFLYAAGIDFKAASFYTLKLNASKNFRIPTYNDLYWYNSGNTELKAEHSDQFELGNSFQLKNFNLTLTGYYNKIKNMIHWVPTANGLWKPQNEDDIATYGGEALLGWKKKTTFGYFTLNGTYAYTVSKNNNTKKQLIYVPYHKATGSIGYRYRRFSLGYQYLFVGEVFTRTDNNPKYTIPAYAVSNISAGYYFDKKKQSQLGFKVLNFFDETYQSVETRFMPGQHFNLYLTFNF